MDSYAIAQSRIGERHFKLSLTGEFDLMSADELEAALGGVISAAQAGTVEIDLDGTTFIDSTTVRALVKAVHRARAAGVVISASNAHGLVRRVFEVTGVLDYLSVHRAEEPGRQARDRTSS